MKIVALGHKIRQDDVREWRPSKRVARKLLLHLQLVREEEEKSPMGYGERRTQTDTNYL